MADETNLLCRELGGTRTPTSRTLFVAGASVAGRIDDSVSALALPAQANNFVIEMHMNTVKIFDRAYINGRFVTPEGTQVVAWSIRPTTK
jgi:hypothetical protein